MAISEIRLFEDANAGGEWRVEYENEDGGCYVTIFAGPAARQRANDYVGVLKSGKLEPAPAAETSAKNIPPRPAGPNLAAVVISAQEALARHLEPDGPSAEETINDLFAILDDEDLVSAMAAAGHIKLEGERKHPKLGIIEGGRDD
jgi:hypothetical protein